MDSGARAFNITATAAYEAGQSEEPPGFRFRVEATLHITAQIINVFLCHAEFQIHPDDIVLGLPVCLERGENIHLVVLRGPDDGAAVNGIPGKPVQFSHYSRPGGITGLQCSDRWCWLSVPGLYSHFPEIGWGSLAFRNIVVYTFNTNGLGLALHSVGQNRLISSRTKERPFEFVANPVENILVEGSRLADQAF